jgi:hypothetical protein
VGHKKRKEVFKNTGQPVYVIAASRPWNRRVLDEVISSSYSGKWHFVGSFDELSLLFPKAERSKFPAVHRGG